MSRLVISPASFEILPFVIEKLSRLPVSDATVKAQSAIGRLYYLLGDFDLAITYFTKALENQKQLNSSNNLAMIYKYLAEAYFSKRDYQSAKEYAEKSLNYCDNHTQPFLQVESFKLPGNHPASNGSGKCGFKKIQNCPGNPETKPKSL